MNRRGFLGAILAAGVAPAAVGSGILMPVRPPIYVPKMLKFRRYQPYQRAPAGDHAMDALRYLTDHIMTADNGGSVIVNDGSFARIKGEILRSLEPGKILVTAGAMR